MKTFPKNILLGTLVFGLSCLIGCSSSKKVVAEKSSVAPSSKVEVNTAVTSYIGTWGFVVKGTPDGDLSGDMIISQNGTATKGVIASNSNQTEIQEMVLSNNSLKGTFYYNGMNVNINGVFTNNSFEGKVEAQGYTFPIIANKK